MRAYRDSYSTDPLYDLHNKLIGENLDMQKSLNGAARRFAYTLGNNPVKMFRVPPVAISALDVAVTIKLDMNRRRPVNPQVAIVPNFVGMLASKVR